jgi:hypothetical protein
MYLATASPATATGVFFISRTDFIRNFFAAKTAIHANNPVPSRNLFRIQPQRKAITETNMKIDMETLKPRSFFIIRNWAIQGTNRVRVTAATVNWVAVSRPLVCRS